MSDQLIALAIDNISKTDFEAWAQKVLTKAEGMSFAPTGGIHDGGQDGFIRSLSGSTEHFVQITKQADTRRKVRETVESIRTKRMLSELTLVTSQVEQNRDLHEASWGQEFNIKLRIHDRSWLLVRASLDTKLKEELYSYVRGLIDELTTAKNVRHQIGRRDRLSIVTYLETQARSLPTSEDFQNICLDTVIYETLVGTDPKEQIFKSADEIRTHLKKDHQRVLGKAQVELEDRLDFLSSKGNDPRIRRHGTDKFALPYEVRKLFGDIDTSTQNLEDQFTASLSARIRDEAPGIDTKLHGKILNATRSALFEVFRQQAVNFSNSFSSSHDDPDINVFEIIRNQLSDMDMGAASKTDAEVVAASALRRACYSSNKTERKFLETLMKYYTVQFVMNGDAVIHEYFSQMASRLNVYLGTDIIVRCLSETFVKERSRGMTNALKRIAKGGVTLRLTRRTLEEVFSHIHTTYLTFRNDFENLYRNGSVDELKQSDKILIRAFGYAYFEPLGHWRQPRDWSDFLNQLGSASWFSDPIRDTDDFGSFLLEKFDLEFVELDGITSKIDNALAQEIADDVMGSRDRGSSSGQAKLALNDAQMALLVTAERNANGERVTSDLYGYNTWWMTEETKILRELRKRDLPSNIVMHPQFLINHLMIEELRHPQDKVQNGRLTPTLFGLKITDRVPQATLRKFLDAVKGISELDDTTQRARVRSAANRLKSKAGTQI